MIIADLWNKKGIINKVNFSNKYLLLIEKNNKKNVNAKPCLIEPNGITKIKIGKHKIKKNKYSLG